MTKPPKIELVSPADPSIEAEAAPKVPDPYDLDSLSIDDSYLSGPAAKKLILTIPIRKPGPQEFCRVHPDPAYRCKMVFYEDRDEKEIYAISPANEHLFNLSEETFSGTLYLAINTKGVVFLWPVRGPDRDGRHNEFRKSADTIAQRMMTKWLRMKANMSLRGYDCWEAEIKRPDPVWPDLLFQEIFNIGFRDKVIDKPDHEAILKLRRG